MVLSINYILIFFDSKGLSHYSRFIEVFNSILKNINLQYSTINIQKSNLTSIPSILVK